MRRWRHSQCWMYFVGVAFGLNRMLGQAPRSIRRVRFVMLERNLKIDSAEIAEFCKCKHIRKLSIFGSAVRDDF